MPHSPQRIRRWLITSSIASVAAVLSAPMVRKLTLAQSTDQEGDRYTRGIETLKRVGGTDYDRALLPLETFLPDLARLVVESGYGDVMSRPGLGLQEREIVNVAALIATGSVRSALEYHIHGMLNVGCSPQAVVEIIFHAVVYAGFPAALDSMAIAREVFKDRNVQFQPVSTRPQGDRYQLGIQNLRQTRGNQTREIVNQFADVAPDLSRLTVEFARGEVWNRPGLSWKLRELATLAMLVAVGNHNSSVKRHTQGAIQAGATETEIKELLLQMTGYAGYPKALAAVIPVQQAFAEVQHRGIPTATPQPDLETRQPAETNEVRYRRGLEFLNQISKASGEAVVKSFEDIAPDLGRYILEFAYGDVFSRPNLDLKTRELATVSALTALNTAASELPLNVHINGALNVGASRQEIVEAIMQMIPYVGFVKVQQAMAIAEDVFKSRET